MHPKWFQVLITIQLTPNQHELFHRKKKTCDHFDINAQIKCPSNSFCAIMPRRVKKRQQTNELPWTTWTLFPAFWNFLLRLLVKNNYDENKSDNKQYFFSPGMPLQEIAGHALRICQSLHGPFVRSPTCCVQVAISKTQTIWTYKTALPKTRLN